MTTKHASTKHPTSGFAASPRSNLANDDQRNAWVLVSNPGTDDQHIDGEYPTFEAALRAKKKQGDGDIMKRLDEKTLTTEY